MNIFEYLINIKGPTKAEKYPKNLRSSDFLWHKCEKLKGLGRDLKILSPPSKKYCLFFSDGFSNFLKWD